MSVRRSAHRGFTLTEVIFTLTLLIIIAAMSMSALRPAKAKGPTRGLAMALSEELSAARQLAISSGHPVALGIPTNGGRSPVGNSVYRLEGWNMPTITWSKGFGGDYPGLGFAAAKWGGDGDWNSPEELDSLVEKSSVSKLAGFTIDGWLGLLDSSLKNRLERDYLFCFTPDGALITNKLPALSNRYTLVVGRDLTVSYAADGSTVSAAEEPLSLMVSPFGGVEIVTGTPGTVLPRSTGPTGDSLSEPAGLTEPGPGSVSLTNIVVTPRIDGAASNEGVCVPGEYVTLEIYAYDPQGRGLFAKWKQLEGSGVHDRRGIFTYPDGFAGDGAVLASEVDRMEYVNEAPKEDERPELTWKDTHGNEIARPTGGVFRARWGWTVPMDSKPGDIYEIQVDVKDASGEAVIEVPEKLEVKAPKINGKVIVERWDNAQSIWQLVRLTPQGAHPQLISPPGVEETHASLSADGETIAVLQSAGGGLKRVKVRPLDGGPEWAVENTPGNYTSLSLSPNGTWVSYRDENSPNQLIVSKVDGSSRSTLAQGFEGSAPIPPRVRSGWTLDSKFVIYEHSGDLRYRHLASGTDDVVVPKLPHGGGAESLYAPVAYQAGGQQRLLFSVGNINPLLVSVAIDQSGSALSAELGADLSSYSTAPANNRSPMRVDIDGGAGGGGSDIWDDCYPNISGDHRHLVLNRTPNGASIESHDQTSLFLPVDGVGNFKGGPGRAVELVGPYRRPTWVP